MRRELGENAAEVDRLMIILRQFESRDRGKLVLENENLALKEKIGSLGSASEQLQNYVHSVDERNRELLYQLDNERKAQESLRVS